MAFAGIAPPDPFLPTPGRPVQPWSRWHDMFKVYLLASGASEFSPEQRKAILLHYLGPEGQRIFNTLSVSQPLSTSIPPPTWSSSATYFTVEFSYQASLFKNT
ncbi:hypothetical protein MTO96_032039 [Rhipicephalus appendiculatus]